MALLTIRRLASLVLTAATLTSGCGQDGPERAFDRYLDRLGRPLSVDVPPVTLPSPPPLPSRASLRLELASTQLGTLDFLALTGCEVQITIGKRNSSLGRMASASQRLLLDLEYLRLAPACIVHMTREGKAELAAVLREAQALKRSQLPARIFLATLGGPEFRKFWRAPLSEDYPAQTSSAVVSALEAILADSRRWLAGDYRADNQQFELQLSDVARGDGGALLQALALQSGWLATANAMLEARRERGPLCTELLRPAAADILPNVVRKFFVGEIQPRSAAIGRRQYQLLPPIRALESELSAALPKRYRDWLTARDAAMEEWREAPKRHVEAVQALLAPCQ